MKSYLDHIAAADQQCNGDLRAMVLYLAWQLVGTETTHTADVSHGFVRATPAKNLPPDGPPQAIITGWELVAGIDND